MQSPRVSVIVPVYKVEKYLRRCVDSILSQTYTDFELLLIDDGSPDNSGKICDEYAAFDSRVRVFHKPNGGVSSARNLGLDNALGEWISFIDSDDWIDVHFLQDMSCNNDVDLVVSSFTSKGANTQWSDKVEAGLYDRGGLGPFLESYCTTCQLMAPWGKLFKTEKINESRLRFDQRLDTREDTIFVLQYLIVCERIKVLEETLYYYWIEGSSLSSNLNNHNSQYLLFLSEYKKYALILAERKCARIEVLLTKVFSGVVSKQLSYIINGDLKTIERYRFLKTLLLNEDFRIVFEDHKYLDKGGIRKVFDFLIIHKFVLLSFLILRISGSRLY